MPHKATLLLPQLKQNNQTPTPRRRVPTMTFKLSPHTYRPRNLALALVVAGFIATLASRHPAVDSALAQSGAPGGGQAPALLVTTAVAKSESVQLTVSGIGNALALASVTVRARVDGQLESVNFEEGQEVKAGQVLARLDARTFQAQLDQAKAQKAKDAAQLANAQNDLKRYESLIKDDATTQQVLDTQTALVNQLRAAVQADDAQVNLASVQLGFTTIAAPISGRVGARLIDPGNIVHATDATGLMVINQVDPIAVQFALPESHLPALQQALGSGRKQRLKVEAIDRATQAVLGTGELVLVNNQIDMATGTVVLKARIPNPKLQLWPGQSVNARLTLTTLSDVVTVPSSAVQRSQQGLFVYVVGSGDKVHVQPVTVSQTEGTVSVVAKGLKAGDRVVTDGMYRLVEGAAVKEVSKEAGGAAKSSAPASAAGAKP